MSASAIPKSRGEWDAQLGEREQRADADWGKGHSRQYRLRLPLDGEIVDEGLWALDPTYVLAVLIQFDADSREPIGRMLVAAPAPLNPKRLGDDDILAVAKKSWQQRLVPPGAHLSPMPLDDGEEKTDD